MSFCTFCHAGRFRRRTLAYLQWHENGLLVVNRMPAVVCDVCGEHIYDQEAVDHLQQLLWSMPPALNSPAAQQNR